MREESGRSLIEIVGVLALGVAMIVAGYMMYKTIDQRQKRLIASETIEDVAKKVKILYEYSGYPDTIKLSDLVDAGAISNQIAPIGTGWKITGPDDETFLIKIEGLSFDECEYFIIKKAEWAEKVYANNENSSECKTTGKNSVFFKAH